MDNNQETDKLQSATDQRWKTGLRNTAYILLALITFLFTLDLMIASLQHLGRDTAEVIMLATSNPFTGLFIGLLVTAIIQSSSATTSMIVAMVASGAIPLEGAIPILMGANIGTTITSTIISLGFITRKKEFRRAVIIGTYHDFFNILTVLILFPLEYYFGFLSSLAQYLATAFFDQPIGLAQKQFNLLGDRFGFIINFLVATINNGFILAVLSIALLFGSILFFRRVLSRTLGFGSQDRFQQFFFRSPMKSFVWGLLTTAAIRSSTVTTSLVVPLVAKKVVKIKSAFPFVMGANIGTTITAFIAAMFNSNAAISIAIAHFLFNLIGVLIFFPLPVINQLPVKLADALGRLTLKYRLAGFLYVLLTFFFIPFSLIYFNKDSVTAQELLYQRENLVTGENQSYTVINKIYLNQPITNWIQYEPSTKKNIDPLNVQTVYRRKNLFLLNNELFEFNKPGFCRDGEDEHGKFKTCIREIIPSFSLSASLKLDSVYVFVRTWYQPERVDSTSQMIYISASRNTLVKKEIVGAQGKLISKVELYQVNEK